MKPKVGLLAYGLMGEHALKGLLGKCDVTGIVLPAELEDLFTSLGIAPAEKLAVENNIPVYKGGKKDQIIELAKNSDAVVIATYNQILTAEILQYSKFINIHHGNLPRWRGRAGINWAIILGRKDISFTIHEAIPDLDAGKIYVQEKIEIGDHDTTNDVYNKLNQYLETNLGTIVCDILDGKNTGVEQKGEGSYTCTRLPMDGEIDWNKSTAEIYRFIRALVRPYGGAFSYFDMEDLRIWSAEVPVKPNKYEGRIPGRIIGIYKGKGVEVLTGDSSIIIKDVGYQGKDMNASDVIKSVKVTLGLSKQQLLEEIKKLKGKL